MFDALAKSLSQLSDPAFRKVLLTALLSSFLVFTLLWVVASFGVSLGAERLETWLAAKDWDPFWTRGLDWVLGGVSVATLLLVSFLLFPAAVLFVLSFLLEPIAAAVERRHYPNLPPARPQPMGEMMTSSLSFLAIALIINLLALPFYLIFLFLPPFNLILFYSINGYLLGREYYEVVAFRRLSPKDTRTLRRRHRFRVFLAGVVVAFLLTIPVLNLLSPLVATAFMVHLFETQRRSFMR